MRIIYVSATTGEVFDTHTLAMEAFRSGDVINIMRWNGSTYHTVASWVH